MRNSRTSVEHFHLGRLVRAISEGKVGIPEFQRDFDWNESDITSLLSTIFAGWPAGSLLLLQSGENLFKLRALENAPPLRDVEYIVLDGQQRLTSLYQALYGTGELIFAIKWDVPFEEELDDAISSFRRAEWQRKYSTFEDQAREKIIPVADLKSASDFFEWRDEVVSYLDECDAIETRDHLTRLYKNHLSALHDYEFPVVRIDKTVNPAAISRIFEKVNKTGMTLNAFDLMVAKSFEPGWNLRDQWANARESFPRLEEFFGEDGLPLLQAISIKKRFNLRQAGVLGLSKGEVHQEWWPACEAADRTIKFLREYCGVLRRDFLPLPNLLPPLIALETINLVTVEPLEMERWFWSAGFAGLYDVAANTRLVRDYRSIVGSGDFVMPDAAVITPSLATKRTQKAVWFALVCAIIRDTEERLGEAIPMAIEDEIEVSSLFGMSEVIESVGERAGPIDMTNELRGSLNIYLTPKSKANAVRKNDAAKSIELCAEGGFGDFAYQQLPDGEFSNPSWFAFRYRRADWLKTFLARKGISEVEVIVPEPDAHALGYF